ncbi:MAG: pitrilysin family protein [Pirellulaceae bacterium]|nr:pitrilysin family protein [Pirellulaceae bacterium]
MFHHHFIRYAITGILMMVGSSVAGGPPKEVATVEGIAEYRLDNGVRLLLFPDGSRPTVTVNLTVFVGSRHEGAGEGGMAHLLEHMVFKGTPTHGNIPALLQERGARFNGTTNSDRTNYYETLPADGENLEIALRLEADRLVNSLIRGEDLASEMSVVRSEFERSENSPQGVLMQKMMAAAYEWHNYGKPTIGNRSDIERVPVEKLRVFYKKYYQPDNVMLVIAGRFDRNKALELTQKYFGAIPRPTRKLPRTYTEEPAQDGERTVVLQRVGEVGIAALAYHIPAAAHPDFASLDVLGEILTRPPAGRLYKSLVETKKAASVMGGAMPQHDPGLFFIGTQIRPTQSMDDVREILLHDVETIATSSITADEVERAKRNLLNSQEQALANSSRLAVSLSSWAGQGDWRLFFLHRDNLEQVTSESVQAVATKYLKAANRTMGIYIPTENAMRVVIPKRPDLDKIFKSYRGREAVAAGEQFDATPENIEARTKRLTIGDLKVALLPKKTRGEVVNLQLTLRYGNEENLQGMQTACSILPSLMVRSTQKISKQELQDALDKYQARLFGYGGTGYTTFSLRTKREHLAATLDLLMQVLREPALEEEEFQVLRQQRLAGLERAKTDPQALSQIELGRTLSPYSPGDVRYTPSVGERMERTQATTLAQVRRVYEDFLGTPAGELVMVGDFDTDEVLPQLRAIVADWQPQLPFARIRRPAITTVEGGHRELLTPDKANAVYYSGFVLPMDDKDPDYPALVIANNVLGSSGLASRLGNRVRQKEGLSYSIRSSLSSSHLDKRTEFGVYAISNPANMHKVIKAIGEELQLLLDKGVTEAELEEAKQGYLQRQSLSRNSDRTLISVLASTLDANRTMEFYSERENAIKELTVETVQAALRKHFRPARLVIVTAGDFEKTE